LLVGHFFLNLFKNNWKSRLFKVLNPFSEIGASSYVSVMKQAELDVLASSFNLNDQCDARLFLQARHLPQGTLTIKF
jgi:hypothetical protein